MKRANGFKQNSRDWYAWRDKGLGASDVPAVMGLSPWTTYFELWMQKTGILPKPEANAFAVAAMNRGRELEPVARKRYEEMTGYTVESDVNCEHETYPFLRASLDGLVWIEGNLAPINLEIKCPSKVDHAMAVKGKIPKKYVDQVQAQLLVTGLGSADYFSFDGKDGVIVPVVRDEKRCQEILEACLVFWKLVVDMEAPKVQASDIAAVVKHVSLQQEKLQRYINALNILSTAMSDQSSGEPETNQPNQTKPTNILASSDADEMESI